jgi:ribosome-associated protein
MKLADLIDRGSDAKAELAAGAVTVNDDVETRRGRQLRPGDTVVVGGRSARVVRS